MASEGLSDLMHLGLEKSMSYLPDTVEPVVVAELDSLWFQEGRFFSRVRFHGQLSDPEVDVENKFSDVKELTKGKLKELGKSLLEGLFD